MLDELQPGDRLLRREVHKRFGGRQQGGIAPSLKAPVVMFFTDPVSGHKHGYYDGWDADGLFNYVGEGQRGDQRLVQGNKAILDHLSDGRSLEGFLAKGTEVTYLGDFELVDHYFTDAHETDSHALRQVVVFRLRPFNPVPVDLPSTPFTPTPWKQVQVVPIEEEYTERHFVNPNRELIEAEERESLLVHKYSDYLRRQGHEVMRLRILPPGETAPLYTDLWDKTSLELIEVKGNITRENVRNAVGRLLDCVRFIDDVQSRRVLLPSRPRSDLMDYLHSVDVGAVYPEGDDWVRA